MPNSTDTGLYQRHSDTLTEEDDLDSANEIAFVLGWMGGMGDVETSQNTFTQVLTTTIKGAVKKTVKTVIDNTIVKKSRDKQRLDRLTEAGLTLQGEDKIAALNELRAAAFNVPLIVRAGEALSNMAQPLLNIISDQRTKSLALTLGAVGIGAGVGFALGTFLFPVIGSAGGLIAGGLAASAVAAGGGIGLGILGGTFGAWLGPRLSEVFFKDESDDLTKKQKRSLINMGISQQMADQMNAYLKNRENNVRSALCQRVYQTIRKVGIKEADPEGMDQVARFFCHELVLLERERAINIQNDAIANDIAVVQGILGELARTQKLSFETRNKIQKTLSDYEAYRNSLAPSAKERPESIGEQPADDTPRSILTSKPAQEIPHPAQISKPVDEAPRSILSSKPAEETPRSILTSKPAEISKPAEQNSLPPRQKAMQFSPTPDSKSPRGMTLLSPEQLEEVERRFKQSLSEQDYIIKKIKSDPQTQNANSIDRRYRVKKTNDVRLTEIDFHEEMLSEDHLCAQVLADRRMDGKIDELAPIMAAYAKAYLHEVPNAVVTVVALKDDTLAIQLMAAALSQGLTPLLDEEEYPANTVEAKAKKEKIIHEAYELANVNPPNKPRIGLKIDTPKRTQS